MAIIKKDADIAGKKHNKGMEAMFVGYAKDHAMGVYRWYCIDTASIRESRDCRFLNMSYAQWRKRDQTKTIQWVDEVELEQIRSLDVTQPTVEATVTPTTDQEGRFSETTNRMGKEPQGIIATPLPPELRPTSNNRMLIRELSRLGTSYNEQATKMAEEMRHQTKTSEEKEDTMDLMEEVGGMAHEYDVAFYAALKMEKTPATENDETYNAKNLEELMHELDSVIANKSMSEELKNEKLRVIVTCSNTTLQAPFRKLTTIPLQFFVSVFEKQFARNFETCLRVECGGI